MGHNSYLVFKLLTSVLFCKKRRVDKQYSFIKTKIIMILFGNGYNYT